MNSSPVHPAVDVCEPGLSWTSAEQTKWPNPETASWLCGQGSLTQLLKRASADQFAVQVLDEHEQAMSNPVLRAEFGPVSDEHLFWSRKVVLHGKGQPWVLAHTLMPAHSELSELRQVRHLGNRPLGEFLFDHPELQRSHLHFTCLPSATNAAGIWGRKSLFFLFGKPIMVAEFFLPELLQLPVPD